MTLTWKHLQRRTLLKLTDAKKKETEQHLYDKTQNTHKHY